AGWLQLLLVSSLIFASGCEQQTAAAPDGLINIKRLAMAYGQFVNASGRPPRDEAEFRVFIEKQQSSGRVLQPTEGDLFTSPRDGKPYVIPYGKLSPAQKSKGVAAYEQTGLDGKRQIAFTIGMVEEADDARMNEILGNPK